MNKVKYRRSWLFVLILLSCNREVSIDKKDLIDYFETKDITANKKQNCLEVHVNNSPFVESKLDQKNEQKSYSLEQFASLGALITSMSIDSITEIDTIFLSIESGHGDARFGYPLVELRKVKKYTEDAVSFVSHLNARDYNKLMSFLSEKITQNKTSQQLDSLLFPLYSPGRILNSKLIAFKISEGLVALYINIYYEGGVAKTYMFNFILNSSGQIEGIQEP